MTAVLDERVPDLLDDLVRTAPPAPPVRRIEARARGVDIPRGLYLVLLAVGSLTGLWITRHGLTTATPAGADVYGHVARTDFALHELFPHGRLDGWFPAFGGGYRLFTVNGPGLALASGLVKAATLGTASTARSFALLGALSIAALPWAVARLSRELGATRLAAAVHGTLALFVSFYAGGGLAGLYGPGLIAQSIALPLQLVALALVINAMRHGNRRTIGLAALVVAGLALLHPISILVLAPFALLGVGRDWLGAPVRRLARGAAVAVLAVALAGVWLVPAVRFRRLQGDATAWIIPPLPTRLGEVLRGDVLLPRVVAWGVVVAALVTLVQALVVPSRWRRLHGFVGALAFLTAAHLAVGHGLGPYNLRVQFPTRGLALAAILLLQPLAELIADATTAALRPVGASVRRKAVSARMWVPLLVVVGLAVCVPWQLRGPLDPPQVAVPRPASLQAAADELQHLVPPMGRHLLVRLPPTSPIATDNASRWLTVASGTNSAHLYFWEATRENTMGVLAAYLTDPLAPADVVGTLRRAGVTDVVVADLALTDDFREQDGFRAVWTAGDITIYEVLAAPGSPPPTALLQPASSSPDQSLEATPRTQRPEHLTWDVDVGTSQAAVAAVNHDPGWTATVDGRSVPLTRSAEGFVQVDLPAGRHRFDLRFTGARTDPLGLSLTLAGLVALVLASLTHVTARERRQNG